MSSDITPFKDRTPTAQVPTRLFKRFKKAAHVAEIRERRVAAFNAVEFIVLVDGYLLESQMFHGQRSKEYAPTVESRAQRFADEGWVEQPIEVS